MGRTMEPSAKRWLFNLLGFVFLGLAALGVVLPVLPTTPLVLLALWAFANGSERMYRYVYTTAGSAPPPAIGSGTRPSPGAERCWPASPWRSLRFT